MPPDFERPLAANLKILTENARLVKVFHLQQYIIFPTYALFFFFSFPSIQFSLAYVRVLENEMYVVSRSTSFSLFCIYVGSEYIYDV